ncbi:hypothetical protein [Accumulibacter sp.]|uniref:hypothetical protein n=1 Tax=Accumulibacter sp. TaxID=2053492 RepID=UPI00338F0DAB
MQNTGTVAAGASKIHYYLSTDNVLSSADTLLGYNYVSSIAASGSASISAAVTLLLPARQRVLTI